MPIRSLYLSSLGFTAIATSANIVSGLDVATIIPSVPSTPGYLKYQYLPFFSSCSTSASERDVPQIGHQFMSLVPLYIKSFSYSLTKNSLTALLQTSSIVKRSRSQSHESPSLRHCSVILPPNSSFHCQTFSKKASLPRSSFSTPSSSLSLSTTFTSVAIEAWSEPGIQRLLYPCILLYLINMSCKVWSRACPM